MDDNVCKITAQAGECFASLCKILIGQKKYLKTQYVNKIIVSLKSTEISQVQWNNKHVQKEPSAGRWLPDLRSTSLCRQRGFTSKSSFPQETSENALTVLMLGKKATRVMNQVINQKIIKTNRVH